MASRCQCDKWKAECVGCHKKEKGGFWDDMLSCQRVCDGDGVCPNCDNCEKRSSHLLERAWWKAREAETELKVLKNGLMDQRVRWKEVK